MTQIDPMLAQDKDKKEMKPINVELIRPKFNPDNVAYVVGIHYKIKDTQIISDCEVKPK